MIKDLKSRLASSKGFTLIELLIVIAIIAILVVIVVVAINPIQRINDANTQAAASNSNAIGSAASVCITDQLKTVSQNNAVLACNSFADLSGGGYTNLSALPTGTTIAERPAACTTTCTDICVDSVVGNGAHRYYTYLTGQVSGTAC